MIRTPPRPVALALAAAAPRVRRRRGHRHRQGQRQHQRRSRAELRRPGDRQRQHPHRRRRTHRRRPDRQRQHRGRRRRPRRRPGHRQRQHPRSARGAQVDGDIETVNGSIFVDRGGRVAKGIDHRQRRDRPGRHATSAAASTPSTATSPSASARTCKGGIKVEKPSTSWLPIHIGKHKPPRIVIGPNAVVDGPLVFEREVKLYVHATARIGPSPARPRCASAARRPRRRTDAPSHVACREPRQ